MANSAVALRLLKQIVSKYSEIIQQGFGIGLVETSKFQAALRKVAAPKDLSAIRTALHTGFRRLYQEVLQPSKAARASLLAALVKRFETACDPVNPEEVDLSLLCLCSEVAACLPLGRMYELLLLLRPIHSISSRFGDNVLAAVKQAQHAGPSPKQRAACTATIYLLLLNNFLIQKYGLTRERLAALEETADKRRAEENRELQVSSDASGLLQTDGLESKDLTEQYTGLKVLLKTFTECHSFMPSPSDDSDKPETGVPTTSPIAARTPLWALNSTDLARAGSGKLLKRRDSTGGRKATSKSSQQRRKSNLSKPQRKRRKSGFSSGSDDPSEHGEDLEEAYLNKKKAAKPRRKLEEALAEE